MLLAHLQFLMELKDCAIKGVGRPVLVVPWVVMQELDALKASSNGRVSTAARAAITSLHDCFTSGHPRVRGQTMDEVCVCVCVCGVCLSQGVVMWRYLPTGETVVLLNIHIPRQSTNEIPVPGTS